VLSPGTEPAEGEVLLGKYRLDRLIGKGGMGKVFRAEDLQNGGTVAVKILNAAAHDDESRKRFAREAKIMGGLDHPNLIRLFGHGEERGFPFLVMRFLEGKNLLDTLDTTTGRMGVAETLDVIGQLAAALDHLHGQGIVHRDLKLSNIFQGPDGKVTLLDMGLARAIPSTTQLTRVGVIWGTPEFMAPEQILGEQKLDGRADVYALAGIFFRIISGRLAFNPGDEQKLLESHVRAPRPDLRNAVPSIPPAVAEVVKTAMSVRRDERYSTAGEFHQALKAAFAGLPPPAPGDSTVVARAGSRDVPAPQVVKLQGAPRPSEFDEPMTMPAIDVAFAQKRKREPDPPVSNPPMERTVVTDIGVPSTSLVGDESTAVVSYPEPVPPRPTRAAPSTAQTDTHAAAGTDPGLTLSGDSESGKSPGAITSPGRPRNKEKDREGSKTARSTVVDEPNPFLADLPHWVTPWVLAGLGAGLVLLGFLLGLLMR
jgi:serine/threonine protein kinase